MPEASATASRGPLVERFAELGKLAFSLLLLLSLANASEGEQLSHSGSLRSPRAALSGRRSMALTRDLGLRRDN